MEGAAARARWEPGTEASAAVGGAVARARWEPAGRGLAALVPFGSPVLSLFRAQRRESGEKGVVLSPGTRKLHPKFHSPKHPNLKGKTQLLNQMAPIWPCR